MVTELKLDTKFQDLTNVEMVAVNGGGGGDVIAAGFGTGLIAWAPVVACVPGPGPIVAGVMVLTGAASIVVATDSDFDLIKY